MTQRPTVLKQKPNKAIGSPTTKQTLSIEKNASLTARPIAGTSGERFPNHIMKKSPLPGYRDPLPDLGDFLYKRLYSDAPEMFYSPQVTPRLKEVRSNENLHSFYGQGAMKRDHSVPIYANLPGDPSFSKTRHLVFKGETTPLTVNTKGLEQERREHPVNLERSPQNMKNVREIPQYVENILASPQNRKAAPQYDSYLPDIRGNAQYSQTSPDERIYRKGNPESPTLKDTSKMRNPIFSDFDFSKYNPDSPKTRFVPESYNYTTTEPLSPSAYAKKHVGYIAKASTQDFPSPYELGRAYTMEDRLKQTITPQYSKIGYDNSNKYEPQRQEFETNKYASGTPKGNGGLNIRTEPNPTFFNTEKSYKSPNNMSYSPVKSPVTFKEEKVIQKSNHYIPFENVKRGIPAAQGEFVWRAEVQKLSMASPTGTGYEQRYQA
jgi:hypothetical protein